MRAYDNSVKCRGCQTDMKDEKEMSVEKEAWQENVK
jgi:hypothetical protein